MIDRIGWKAGVDALRGIRLPRSCIIRFDSPGAPHIKLP